MSMFGVFNNKIIELLANLTFQGVGQEHTTLSEHRKPLCTDLRRRLGHVAVDCNLVGGLQSHRPEDDGGHQDTGGESVSGLLIRRCDLVTGELSGCTEMPEQVVTYLMQDRKPQALRRLAVPHDYDGITIAYDDAPRFAVTEQVEVAVVNDLCAVMADYLTD